MGNIENHNSMIGSIQLFHQKFPPRKNLQILVPGSTPVGFFRSYSFTLFWGSEVACYYRKFIGSCEIYWELILMESWIFDLWMLWNNSVLLQNNEQWNSQQASLKMRTSKSKTFQDSSRCTGGRSSLLFWYRFSCLFYPSFWGKKWGPSFCHLHAW